jgi:hypothetical protein
MYPVSVTSGKSYRVSFYVKSGTSGNEEYHSNFISGGSSRGSVTGESSGGWVEASYYFTAHDGLSYLQLYKLTDSSGTMLFDTVSVSTFEETSTATAELTGEVLIYGSASGTSSASAVTPVITSEHSGTVDIDGAGEITLVSGANYQRRANLYRRAGPVCLDHCAVCGPIEETIELDYDEGGNEPTVGDTLTGATTGDTGVVSEVILRSGAWASGTAAGTIIMTSGTGVDDDSMSSFKDNENITNTTAGNTVGKTEGVGILKRTGFYYPSEDLIEVDGQHYCRKHYLLKFPKKFLDEMDIDFY